MTTISGRVGYIGLGDMGGAMAESIAASHDLVVFDLDPEAIAAVVAHGATAAASARELTTACDHIAICVPDDAAVMEVVAGEDGILDVCDPGTTIAVHSTVHPDTVRDLSTLAAERGVVLFDAGVAGGSVSAREGNLSIMVGVPAGGLTELAGSVLDACGTVFHAGAVGAGMGMKIAFNVMTYFQQAAVSAAHQVAVSEGCDPERLLESWRHVGQLGALTERFFPLVTMSPDEKRPLADYLWGTIGIAVKDLDLAAGIGLESGRPMPVVEAVRDHMALVYGMPPVTSAGDE